jgi:Tfp pilus assembly protein PilW
VKVLPTKSVRAFTLVEMMMSLGCGSMILAAVVASGVCLQRSFAAVEGYSTSEGDQLRVLDYIAMDCRRALSASVSNGTLTLTVPNYYDSSGNVVTPTLTSGTLQYSGGATTTITYAKSGTSFVRTVGPTATWPTGNAAIAIATNISAFTVTSTDLTSTVSCYITFSPRFVYLPGPGPIAGTTIYCNTFLRNAVARN